MKNKFSIVNLFLVCMIPLFLVSYAPPVGAVRISGPTYMGSATTIIWTYDGGVSNAQSYKWWYKKVNNGGMGAIALGFGPTAMFMAVPDTYYSGVGSKTSNFQIYLEVTDVNGKIYTSSTRSIMKKGMYKLTGGY